MITQRIGKIKLRRGTVTQLVEIILEEGELVYLVDKERYMIGDGSTYGGITVSNRSFIVNSYGIPSKAMYGDIIYNTNIKGTYLVGFDTDGKTLKLYEICSYGKLLLLQERLADLFNKIRPLTGFLIQTEPKTSPYITKQPTSQVIDRTLNATFSLTAGGSPTLTYQWYKNNIPILSTNNSSYTINNIQYSDAGNFYCKVTNPYGYAESNIVTLQVTSGVAPFIITHPISQTLNNGSNATFSVSANGGGYTLSFQWYKNNIIINGATSSNYTLTNITGADETNYKCVVSNRFSSVNSNQAYLKVNVGTIPIVTTHPVSVNKNNGLTATFNVISNGTAPITHQWYKNNVLISGATSDVLTLPNVTTSDVAAYKCKVENSFGSIFSNSANLTVNIGTGPVITTQPVSQIINNGLNTTFNVVATGTPTLTYQWYKDNIIISGATNSTYSIVSATVANNGTYKCIITNSFDSATSNDATLTVNVGTVPVITTQPVSLVKNNGLIASFNVVANGSAPLTYQWYKDNVAITGATTNSYIITSVVALNAGNYKCIVSNGFGSVVSNVVSLTVNVGNAPLITTQPISRTLNNGLAATFTVIATGTAPLAYQWYKNGTNLITGATSSTYTVTNISSTDEGTYKCVVSNSFSTVTSTEAVLKVNSGSAPSIITQPTSSGLLISTPTNVTFNVVATGTPTLTYQWYKNNVLISGATSSTYTINNAVKTDEGGYKCIVTNSFGFVESDVAVLTLTIGEKPAISVQPIGQTYIEAGSPVTYSVTATGTAPLTYQWFNNGTAILGATNSTFVINSGTPSYSKLKCKVTNIYGEVFSNEVDHKNVCKLVLNPASLPYGIYVIDSSGKSAFKSIVTINELYYTLTTSKLKNYSVRINFEPSSGGCSIPYKTEIYKNNILVKTENAGVQYPVWDEYDTIWQNLTGEYFAVYTNLSNSVTSAKLTINSLVLTPPTIVIHPIDQTTTGGTVSFSVSAKGSDPLTYQWRENSIDVVGQNRYKYDFYINAIKKSQFFGITDITIDSFGNLYVCNQGNDNVVKIDTQGVITLLATVRNVNGITIDSSGNFYVSTLGTTHSILKNFTSFVGGGYGQGDGTGSQAKFSNPSKIVADSFNNIYIGDWGIRKITPGGVVSTFIEKYKFPMPAAGMTIDKLNNLYVTDGYSLIYKITPSGVISIIAGNNDRGSIDGTGAAARFSNPNGIIIDSSNNLYVCDKSSHIIRKITSAGIVTTIAGTAGQSGSIDGTGAAARFNNPDGITIDSSGNLYVCDQGNFTIRKITPTVVVTTFAGTAGKSGSEYNYTNSYTEKRNISCKVSNDQGSVISNNAILTITV